DGSFGLDRIRKGETVMKRFARALAVILGIVFLGSLVLVVPQKNVTAQSGPTVSIASPLPLPVKGNVGITGTPTVNVGNLPAIQNVSFNGAAQPVTFSSTSASPLFTSDVNAGAYTHDGQKASSLVTLTTKGFSCGGGAGCAFIQVAGDGSFVGSACNSVF